MATRRHRLQLIGRIANNRIFRWAIVVAVLALAVLALADQWPGVRAGLADLSLLPLAASLVAVLIGVLVTAVLWRALLSDLGGRLGWSPALRVFAVAQLGKYVPGSVWTLVGQIEGAKGQGLARRTAATAGLLSLAFSLLGGLLVALATLPWVSADAARRYAWALLVIPAAALLLHPRVVNPIIGWALRKLGRAPLEQPLSWRAAIVALVLSALSWVLFGLHVAALAVPLGAPWRLATVTICVGGFALAWCVGFLVVVAPAGAGVREAVLVAVLLPVLDSGRALVVALVSRLLFSLVDVGLAVAVLALSRRSRQRARAPVAEDSAAPTGVSGTPANGRSPAVE